MASYGILSWPHHFLLGHFLSAVFNSLMVNGLSKLEFISRLAVVKEKLGFWTRYSISFHQVVGLWLLGLFFSLRKAKTCCLYLSGSVILLPNWSESLSGLRDFRSWKPKDLSQLRYFCCPEGEDRSFFIALSDKVVDVILALYSAFLYFWFVCWYSVSNDIRLLVSEQSLTAFHFLCRFC